MISYRKLVETVIGRKLLPTEIVHHINGDHNDNRIDNLYVYNSKSKHTIHHIIVGKVAMRLANCYTDDCILNYVKKRILPMLKKSNIDKLMRENEKL